MSEAEKVAAYRAGRYKFKAPPVCHRLWEEADWIRYISAYGGWL